MKDLVSTVASVALVLAILIVTRDASNKRYVPPSVGSMARPAAVSARPEGSPSATSPRLPLSCAIRFSESFRSAVKSVPGLAFGASNSSLALLRPVGSTLAEQLGAAAHERFPRVVILDDRADSKDFDLVITPDGPEVEDGTGYRFTGLPLLLAGGETHARLRLGVTVSGRAIDGFEISELTETRSRLGATAFPIAQLSRLMTEELDRSSVEIAQKLFDRIANDTRVVRVTQIHLSPSRS